MKPKQLRKIRCIQSKQTLKQQVVDYLVFTLHD